MRALEFWRNRFKPDAPVQIELVDMQTREPVETLEVDAVLVATGRVPSSKHPQSGKALGVETNRGFMCPVDDQHAACW